MNKTVKIIWKILEIALIALTVLGFVKAEFVSLDIDESYAVAEAYRLVSGDKLLYDMWEPHQFTSFIPAFFLQPFVTFTGGTAFSVIYLRIIGCIIHLIIGWFLYRTVRKETEKTGALLVMLFHMNFLPKWVAMPEFELIHYWCLLLIFLLLYSNGKGIRIRALAAGVLYVISGMCYPTMVFVFPLFFFGLFFCGRERKQAYYFTAGAFIGVTVFFLAILSYMSPAEIKTYVGYIFMDASHQTSAADKWSEYARQFLSQGIKIGKSMIPSAVFTFAAAFYVKGYQKKQMALSQIVVMFLFGIVTVLSIRAIIGFLFGNENQFFFQIRYVVCTVAFIYLAIKGGKNYRFDLFIGILPSVVSLIGILFVTNMDTNTAYAKLMPAIVIGFFMQGKLWRKQIECAEFSTLERQFGHLAAGMMIICFLICRLVLIRVNGCLPVTIKAPMTMLREGPAAGVFVMKDIGDEWNNDYEVFKNLVPKGKPVLYIGAEQLFYVAFCDRVCTPSVQGTTVFNEMYGEYYKRFPEKKPVCIVIDHSFDKTVGYYYSPENEYIYEWIHQNFETVREEDVGFYHFLYSQ